MASETSTRPAPPGSALHPTPASGTSVASGEGTHDADVPEGMRRVAVVLIDTRIVTVGQHTYHVPAGQVIRIETIPVATHFDDGPDTELVPAGTLKVGDTVKRS